MFLACSNEPESAPTAATEVVNGGSQNAGGAVSVKETDNPAFETLSNWSEILPKTGTWTFTNAFDHYGRPLSGVIREGQFEQVSQDVKRLKKRGPVVDLRGSTLVPGLIDSHVHLSYFDGRASLEQGGVFAAVDLAAPLDDLFPLALDSDFYLLSAGPMVTAIAGYPTQGWGRNGYGLEVASIGAAEVAVAELIAQGAGLIKVPVDGDNGLGQELLERVVAVAHAQGRLVVAHALSSAGFNRARRAGVDGLAHTPTSLMTEEEAQNWRGGFVLSTLYAFGASENAIENVRRLSDAGAMVLYGTDLGNRIFSGFDTLELELLRETLNLSAAEAIELATSEPAALWDLPVGRIEPGYDASFLMVATRGVRDLATLNEPEGIIHRGVIK